MLPAYSDDWGKQSGNLTDDKINDAVELWTRVISPGMEETFVDLSTGIAQRALPECILLNKPHSLKTLMILSSPRVRRCLNKVMSEVFRQSLFAKSEKPVVQDTASNTGEADFETSLLSTLHSNPGDDHYPKMDLPPCRCCPRTATIGGNKVGI